MKRTMTGTRLEYGVALPSNHGGSLSFHLTIGDHETPPEVRTAMEEEFAAALRAGGADWRVEVLRWPYLTPLFKDVDSIESRIRMVRPIMDSLLAGHWEGDDLALVNWAVAPLLRAQREHWLSYRYKERHRVTDLDLDGVVADFEALRMARRPLLRHHLAGEVPLNDPGLFTAVHLGLEPLIAYMICMLANGRGEIESEVWAGNPRFVEAEEDLKSMNLAKSVELSGRVYLTRSRSLARKLSAAEAMPIPHTP